MSILRAAASAVQLTDEAFPGTEPVFAKGHEGEFRATALVVEAETRLCFISIDALVPPTSMIRAAARRIAETTSIPAENVLLCATHTHSGPTTHDSFGATPNPEYKRRMEEGAVQAVQQACAILDDTTRPPDETQVELLLGLSQEATIGRNSRLLLKDGQIGWYNYEAEDAVRPTGPHDVNVPVLVFRRPDGSEAGVLLNHSVHNIGATNWDVFSPAFSGLARGEIEQRHGTTALFLPGAFGSSHNNTYNGGGLEPAELVVRLVAAVEEGLQSARPCLFGPVQVLQRPFEYRLRAFDEAQAAADVRRYSERYFGDHAEANDRMFASMRAEMISRQGEQRTTLLTVIRLGEVALVGIPGEMYARLGLDLRRRSPFRHTILVGLGNEEIGYIPDLKAYEDGGYQTWVGWHCCVAPGTGEAMVEQALEMLQDVFDDRGGPDVPDGACRDHAPTIRELRADDGPALQRFFNSLAPQTRRLFRPAGWNMSLQQCSGLCRQSADGERYDLVLEDRGRIVGWSFLQALDRPAPSFGIGLAEAYHGRGYGRELMGRILAWGREAGRTEFELTVVQSNERAQRLYESFGFTRTGMWQGSDGLDYYEMRLTL
ncbi:GNAT family N-acetyltransferase [bacterium]|nr:GNAT family N-acetyltransferase [bacterium]